MIARQISKKDGTNKFLFCLEDGNVVESVLMRYKHGNSACISSQVGCRMGCRFCASTLDGLERGLTISEMLEQVYQIQKICGERISHVVVMGTGEPLDNYENLVGFLKMISDAHGLHISQRNITVSTCGIVPKILELAKENFQITLALSLHGSTQEKRKRLMPVAGKYPLGDVMEACDVYFQKTGRRISYEYSLVQGVNDTAEDIEELIRLLRRRNCHLNLIPVNPVKERGFERPTRENAEKFKNKLEKSGINVTIRREMGSDIDGACGQLRRRYMREQRKDSDQMKTFSITDVGMVRTVNQDYVFVTDKPLGHLPNLFVVADGMGGHQAGDYASKFTVDIIKRELRRSRTRKMWKMP